MITVKKSSSVEAEDMVCDVESFDGGKASLGIVTGKLAAGVGSFNVGRERSCDEGLFDTFNHCFSSIPGAVYKEEAEMGVFFS